MTTIDQLNLPGQGYLPGLIGIEFLTLEPGSLTSRLVVRPELLAPMMISTLYEPYPLSER